MAHTSPQFTPTQILAAGERAEAEGKREYAVQFYRHLVEHHTPSVEALIARNGLDRLAPAHVSLTSLLDEAGQHTWSDSSAQEDWSRGPRTHAEAGYGRPAQPEHTDGVSGYPAPAAATAHVGEAEYESWPNRHDTHSEPERGPRITQPRVAPLPPVPRPFLAGRILAAGLSVAGLVAAALALVVLVTGLIAPDQIMLLARSLGPWSAIPLSGMGATLILGAGLSSLLVGQLAGALFAIAGACRDTAGLLRHAAGEGRSTSG